MSDLDMNSKRQNNRNTKWAHLAGFEPSTDAVEMEGMIAYTCRNMNQAYLKGKRIRQKKTK